MVELSSYFANTSKNKDSVNNESFIQKKDSDKGSLEIIDCRPGDKLLRISTAYNLYIHVVDERNDKTTNIVAYSPKNLNFKFSNQWKQLDPFNMSNGGWVSAGVQIMTGKAGNLARDASTIYYWGGGDSISMSLEVRLYATDYLEVEKKIFKPIRVLAGLAQPTTDASDFLLPPGPAPLSFDIKWTGVALKEEMGKDGKIHTVAKKDAKGNAVKSPQHIKSTKGVRTDIKIGDWFYLSDVLIERVIIDIPMQLAKKFRSTTDGYGNDEMKENISKGEEEEKKLDSDLKNNENKQKENNKAIEQNKKDQKINNDKIEVVTAAENDFKSKTSTLNNKIEKEKAAYEKCVDSREKHEKAVQDIENWEVENKEICDKKEIQTLDRDYKEETSRKANNNYNEVNKRTQESWGKARDSNVAVQKSKENYEKLANDLSNYREELESAEKKFDDQTARQKGAEKSVQNLKKQEIEAQSKVNELKAKIDSGDTSEETLRAYEQALHQCDIIAESLIEEKTKLDNITKVLKQYKTNMENAQNQVSKGEDDLRSAQANIDYATTKWEEAVDEYNRMKEIRQEAESERDIAKKAFDKSQGKLNKTEAEFRESSYERREILNPNEEKARITYNNDKRALEKAGDESNAAYEDYVNSRDARNKAVRENGSLEDLNKNKEKLEKEGTKLADKKDQLEKEHKNIEDKIKNNKNFLATNRKNLKDDEYAKPFMATVKLDLKTKYVTTQEEFRKILSGEPIPKKTKTLDIDKLGPVASAAFDTAMAAVHAKEVEKYVPPTAKPTTATKFAQTKNVQTTPKKK